MITKKWVVGNWKLNHLSGDTQAFFEALLKSLPNDWFDKLHIGVAPVAPLLSFAVHCVKNSRLQIAAQNVYHQESGAFTGEWSVAHLKELGVSWAIVGHSERRQYFAETSEQVAWKAKACLEHHVTPVVCVGETLSERESGSAWKLVESQLKPVLDQVEASQICVAYEPVWAIGTGKVANPAEINEMHNLIRNYTNEQTPILYGGSVNAANARSIFEIKNVNGALVGGASLKAESFLSILNDAAQCKY